MKYEPSEIICNEAFLVSGFDVDDLKVPAYICPSMRWNPICSMMTAADGS